MSDPQGPFHSTFGDLPSATERVELNRTLAVGLAEASKVVVLDTNKDLSGLRNVFSQTLRNLYADKPFYRLDGSNDYVEYADNDDLDMGIYDFALRVVFKADSVGTANQFLMNKETGGIGYGLEIREDDLWIRFDDNTTDATAKIATAVFTAEIIHDVVVNFDRSGNGTAYVDGVNVGVVDISGTALTLNNAGALRIGTETGGTTKPFKGEIYDWGVWNALIPTAQVLELQSGGCLNFLDIGASSLNHLNEPAFTTHANWDKTGKATDDVGAKAEWTFAAGALGGKVAGGGGHHTPIFDIDEDVLPLGTAMLAETARRFATGESD